MAQRPKWAPVFGPLHHNNLPVIAAVGLPVKASVDALAYLCPACGKPHLFRLPAPDLYKHGAPLLFTLECPAGTPIGNYYLRAGTPDSEPQP
jgi:hypothetical protein